MGEKIKDLHEISIGSEKFMIELNEGYLKDEGRLIHIQNKHFRYLLKEKQFIRLASSILRAREEMKYYKITGTEHSSREIVSLPKPLDADVKKTEEFVSAMSHRGIEIKLIEVRRGFATILVNDRNYKEYRRIVKELGAKKTVHPCSEKLGYHFLYQMRPFELYVKDGFFFEFMFKLPCASLTPKSYIPLDRRIQEYVFSRECKGDIKRIDNLSYCIYRICLAIFERKKFTADDVDLFRINKDILLSKDAKNLLETVFFGFTDELSELLANNKIADIIPAYYSFSNY